LICYFYPRFGQQDFERFEAHQVIEHSWLR